MAFTMRKELECNTLKKTVKDGKGYSKKETNMNNIINRCIFGALMLILYLFLCAKHTIFSILISIGLSTGITYEVINITRKNGNKPYLINRYLIFYMATVIYSYRTILALADFYAHVNKMVRAYHLISVIFSFYAAGLIVCVTQFRKSLLKKQMLLLTIVHITAYLGGRVCAVNIKNISFGKFFYVYPCLLVIFNDIFAYAVGKTIGKTPLIFLSPNKTVEGFFGGFVFTFILGNLLSFLKLNNMFYPDPTHHHLTLPVNSNVYILNFPRLYLYNIAFVFAASFLAPFCGFIASAIKRSFQKKDFGTIIPGHGGLTDRFDCQILMSFFTYYFLSVFGNPKKTAANLIYKFLIENLNDQDLENLCKTLLKN